MKDYLAEFVARKAQAGAKELPTSYKKLLYEAQDYLAQKKEASDLAREIDQVSGFEMDLEAGKLTLKFTEREDVDVEAQIAGTYSNDGSFMWGWGHPSVPQPLQQAAWAAQRMGDRQEIEELMSRGGEASKERVDEYIAITAYLANADGVFTGDHGGGGSVYAVWFLPENTKE